MEGDMHAGGVPSNLIQKKAVVLSLRPQYEAELEQQLAQAISDLESGSDFDRKTFRDCLADWETADSVQTLKRT